MAAVPPPAPAPRLAEGRNADIWILTQSKSRISAHAFHGIVLFMVFGSCEMFLFVECVCCAS
jgi:hypothetical protein